MQVVREFWLRRFALALSFSIIFGKAYAALPVEVEIGGYSAPDSFDVRGHGVLVRYQGDCLLVTLAHVARTGTEDAAFDAVTARWDNLTEATVEYVDHNRNDDIYVGRVPPTSSLFRVCTAAIELEELYASYRTRLRGLLTKGFTDLKLHETPDAIDLLPENDRTLLEAQRSEPIRYRLAECDNANLDCQAPTQKLSGSMLSMALGPTERLMLGLHQGQCGIDCPTGEPVWQAVSVMMIYDFFKRPTFPILSAKRPPSVRIANGSQGSFDIVGEGSRAAEPTATPISPIRQAVSAPFLVSNRNTDVLGVRLGQTLDEVLLLFSSKSGYELQVMHSELSDYNLQTLKYTREDAESIEVVTVDISKNGLVYGVVSKKSYFIEPSIVDWSRPIETKYGPYSYVENGPGYTNIYWDYNESGQIRGNAGNSEYRIICNLLYDNGYIHSIQLSLVDKESKIQNIDVKR